MSGYWSPDYWSEDYWAEDYWPAESSSAELSTLYVERVVEVARFTLNRKDGIGTDDFYVSQDYWDEGTLYTGNPVIYPVLAELMTTPRSVGRVTGTRHDVTIAVFAKSHFTGYQKGFLDLTATHELRNSTVEVRRYWRTKDGVTTHGTANIRQTLEIRGYSVSGGVLRIETRDTWFKDKEISKRLTPTDFPNIQDEFAYEYGAIVFGIGGGNGVIIDAPYIEDSGESFDPKATMFLGWTFPNHPMNSVQQFYVLNPDTDADPAPWLQVGFVGTYTTPWNGDDSLPPAGDQYARFLSLYSRGVVVSPGSNTRIITSVSAPLAAPQGYWAASFDGVNDVLYIVDPSGMSPKDKDFTVGFWVRFTSLGEQAIIAKGELAAGTAEWGVEMLASNVVRFWISTDGANRSYSVSTSALSATTWYHIFAGHDATNDQVFISVDNGIPATSAAVGITVFDAEGPLQIGYQPGLASYFSGRMSMLGYWGGVVGGTERSGIYNSGNGKAYEDLTDGEKTQLVSWWDLGEFYGNRDDLHSSRVLSEAGNVQSAVGKVQPGIDASRTEIRLVVAKALYLPDTNSWTTENSGYRSRAYDMADMEAVITLGYPIHFALDPPLPVSPNVSYFFYLECTNQDDHAYAFRSNYAANASAAHYARINTERGKAWELQDDIELAMAIYALGDDGGFDDTTGSAPYHASYSVRAYIGGTSPASPFPSPTKGLQYKVAVNGLEDDGSGTYTGSASALIRNASDVIRFILMNGDFGLGLTSGRVDTATLDTARTWATANAGVNLSFAIDRQLFAGELLTKICEQTGLILYKSRDGKLKVRCPTYHGGVFAYSLDEGRHRDQVQVLGFDDAPDAPVYNDFLINYGVDPLNLPKSADFVYRAGSNSFAASIYANGSESNISDSNRVAKLAASEAMYGNLQFRRDYDLFAANATNALTRLVRRLIDRFCVKPKRATIRVPLKDYYGVDLFDTFKVRHTSLPAENGTAKRLLWNVDGEQVIWYQDGVPITWMRLGSIVGEVIGVNEFDQHMEVTVETMEPFSNS